MFKLIEKDKSELSFFNDWVSAVDFLCKKIFEKGILDRDVSPEKLFEVLSEQMEKNINITDCSNGKELYSIDPSKI